MDNWKCIASLRGDGMGSRMETVAFSSTSGLKLPPTALARAMGLGTAPPERAGEVLSGSEGSA